MPCFRHEKFAPEGSLKLEIRFLSKQNIYYACDKNVREQFFSSLVAWAGSGGCLSIPLRSANLIFSHSLRRRSRFCLGGWHNMRDDSKYYATKRGIFMSAMNSDEQVVSGMEFS